MMGWKLMNRSGAFVKLFDLWFHPWMERIINEKIWIRLNWLKIIGKHQHLLTREGMCFFLLSFASLESKRTGWVVIIIFQYWKLMWSMPQKLSGVRIKPYLHFVFTMYGLLYFRINCYLHSCHAKSYLVQY